MQKVDERTIYHWASITKTLTAIAIMQLRDRGKLNAGRQGDHLGARAAPGSQSVRLDGRHHHPHAAVAYVRIPESHLALRQRRAWQPFEPTRWEQLVAMMPYQEISFPPGSKYSYSNPALHLPRADHRGDHRRPVPVLHPEEHLDAARHDPELLRRRHRTSSRRIARTAMPSSGTAPDTRRSGCMAGTSTRASPSPTADGMRRSAMS